QINWPLELYTEMYLRSTGGWKCQTVNWLRKGFGRTITFSLFNLEGKILVLRFILSMKILFLLLFVFLNTTCAGPLSAMVVKSTVSVLHCVADAGINSPATGLPTVCKAVPHFL